MNNISIDDLLSIIEYCKNTFPAPEFPAKCGMWYPSDRSKWSSAPRAPAENQATPGIRGRHPDTTLCADCDGEYKNTLRLPAQIRP